MAAFGFLNLQGLDVDTYLSDTYWLIEKEYELGCPPSQ